MKQPPPTPPVAAQKSHTITVHDDPRQDPYYWMRDRENPEVIAYLEAENAYTKASLAHTESFQKQLFEEIKGRIKEDDESVPYLDNDYYYLTRYVKGGEYPIYVRKHTSLDNRDEVMLDVNKLAEGQDYYQVGSRSVSLDNKTLAYGVDTVSRRLYTLHFKNLENGDHYQETIPNTSGSVIWANDNQYLFYVRKHPETLRSYQVVRHRLGTDPAEDVIVFTEEDDTYNVSIFKTKSDKWLVIGSFQTISQEFRILPADAPLDEWRVFQPRERNLEYDIAHFEDRFYVRTNMDAENFRLMVTPEEATTKDNWVEVIPHRPNVLLEDLDIFKDYLVLSERRDGITRLRVRPWDGEEHYIEFPEQAYVAYTSVNLEFDTQQLRIAYQSMKTPPTIFDYHMEKETFRQLKQQEVLGGFDPDEYESDRLYAPAHDGERIPISLVYHRDTERSGKAPLLLYGYGSYGNSMEPFFSPARLSLLNRGFVFAIAHIRGGEEMGRRWYDHGKLLHKKNTFTDFIDCGEFLIQRGYASQRGLYAMGGSAGGLLMGAVANMRPDLWAGIVAAVPFVDVVTTMLDDSIPLTTFEYDEWGNPNDPTYYEYIKSYSPYDNVEAKDYPPMLITTGLHDSQVQYWEPAKWVARLRERKTDNNPLYLHINMKTGHSGASGRFERYKEIALDYAFLIDLAGQI